LGYRVSWRGQAFSIVDLTSFAAMRHLGMTASRPSTPILQYFASAQNVADPFMSLDKGYAWKSASDLSDLGIPPLNN
jgi:hypothetical protein